MSNDLARQVDQMRSRGIPLGEYVGNKIYRGVLTGFNDAFVIDEQKRQQLLEADPKSAELIRPLIIGDDVRRWHLRDKKRYLLFARRGIKIEEYPAVLAHLEQFRERLEPRPKNWADSGTWSGRKPGSYKWYEIQDDIAYFREFDKPKIIYPEISIHSRFTYDDTGKYTNNKAFIIPVDDKYLVGVLGSKIVWRLLQNTCTAVQGNALELKSIYMSKIPIPIASDEEKAEVEKLVEICLKGDEVSCRNAEEKLNDVVEKLYKL